MAGLDTTTLMLMMAMGGGRGGMGGMMLPLLLMGAFDKSGTGGGSGTLDKIGLTTDAMMIGMLPGIGMVGKAMLGGAGAVIAGSMLGKKSGKRRRTRVKYVRSYRRRR